MGAHLLLLAASFVAGITQTTPPLPAGQLLEGVACRSDPTQTYTLYLPSSYSADRTWPLLFVFDPRGRGTMAATLFRGAAERHGWIVVSSNNTQSDGEWEPNRRAVAAMWPDVLAAYPVDERRIYAAGFSGGASLAWVLASNGAPLAGIIASGGPDLPETPIPKAPLSWFAAAGRADFNYLDVRRTADRMERAGLRVRLEHFDAAHQWLSRELADRALAWFEALAIKSGSDGRHEPPHLSRLADEDLAHADRQERSGAIVDAHRTLRVVARDYPGTAAEGIAERRARALADASTLQQAIRLERSRDAAERRRVEEIVPILRRLAAPGGPDSAAVRRDLELDRLLKLASGQGYAAASARRTLETIFVQVSFYMRREFESRKLWAQAAAALEVAVTIHPERPRLWIDLAAAHARVRNTRAVAKALDQAIQLGFRNREELERDPRFELVRDKPEFRERLERIRGSLI